MFVDVDCGRSNSGRFISKISNEKSRNVSTFSLRTCKFHPLSANSADIINSHFFYALRRKKCYQYFWLYFDLIVDTFFSRFLRLWICSLFLYSAANNGLCHTENTISFYFHPGIFFQMEILLYLKC